MLYQFHSEKKMATLMTYLMSCLLLLAIKPITVVLTTL